MLCMYMWVLGWPLKTINKYIFYCKLCRIFIDKTGILVEASWMYVNYDNVNGVRNHGLSWMWMDFWYNEKEQWYLSWKVFLYQHIYICISKLIYKNR